MYKFLNRDILQPALREIKNHTDVSVTHKAVLRGRKTVGVSFTVTRKETHQLPLPLSSEQDKPPEASDLMAALLRHGINKKRQQAYAVGIAQSA